MVRRNNTWLLAAEIKLTNTPVLTKGTYLAMEDLGIEKLHVITPSSDTYLIAKNIEVISLMQVLDYLKEQE